MEYVLWFATFMAVGSLFPIAFWLESRSNDAHDRGTTDER